MIATISTNCNSLENIIANNYESICTVTNHNDMGQVLTTDKRMAIADKVAKHCQNMSKRVGQFDKSLIITTLPKRSKGKSTYTVVNGRQRLDLYTKAGEELPSGTIPRLFLTYICTEAVKTKSPVVNLGSSLYDFMKRTGLDWSQGRGKNSDAKRFKEQLRRLIPCNIEISENTKDFSAGRGMRIFKEWNFFWQTLDENIHSMFDNWVELTDEYYQHIIKNPLPVDIASCAALKSSTLAFDLYIYLNMKVSAGKAHSVPVRCLAQQLGDYKNPKDFKKPFRKALASVFVVWPELEFTLEDGLLTLPKQKTHLQHQELQETKHA